MAEILPKEIWHFVFEYCSERSRLIFRGVCKDWNHIFRFYSFEQRIIARLIDRGINGYRLARMLRETGAVIAGGFALQSVLGEDWPESDIDIFAPVVSMSQIFRWFITEYHIRTDQCHWLVEVLMNDQNAPCINTIKYVKSLLTEEFAKAFTEHIGVLEFLCSSLKSQKDDSNTFSLVKKFLPAYIGTHHGAKYEKSRLSSPYSAKFPLQVINYFMDYNGFKHLIQVITGEHVHDHISTHGDDDGAQRDFMYAGDIKKYIENDFDLSFCSVYFDGYRVIFPGGKKDTLNKTGHINASATTYDRQRHAKKYLRRGFAITNLEPSQIPASPFTEDDYEAMANPGKRNLILS